MIIIYYSHKWILTSVLSDEDAWVDERLYAPDPPHGNWIRREQTTHVRRASLKWVEVTDGILKGLILEPLLILILINEKPGGLDSSALSNHDSYI